MQSSKDKIGFGSKNVEFLKKKSRQTVEKYTDTSLLYFQVDYENSRRNFYGELLEKEWINKNGVKINGIIKLVENEEKEVEGTPNKLMKLTFGCYIDHLKELNVKPQLGDFFASRTRWFYIIDKTLLDSAKSSIGVDMATVTIVYTCVEADEEFLSSTHIVENSELFDDSDINL